mmetsp:Transcript_15024/g.12753  ORF Transcript_15024/g.12753 Transcript_15024/m.12753 type:complete len:113 (-) Transcript_15024:39-377(-)
MNIIMSPKWLLLVPIAEPYLRQREVPIYLNPMMYFGMLVKPVVEDVWPQTGKLQTEIYDQPPSQVLKRCSKFPDPPQAEKDEEEEGTEGEYEEGTEDNENRLVIEHDEELSY